MRSGDACPEYDLVPLVGWHFTLGKDGDLFVTPVGAGRNPTEKCDAHFYHEELPHYVTDDMDEVFDQFRVRADRWFAYARDVERNATEQLDKLRDAMKDFDLSPPPATNVVPIHKSTK